MQGLIIKEIYLERFFSGGKSAEVRSSNTKKRGLIFLCCSKRQEIWGQAELMEVMKVPQQDFLKYANLHQAKDFLGYEINYLWIMKNIKRYQTPIKYHHKPGCVIWINLDEFASKVVK